MVLQLSMGSLRPRSMNIVHEPREKKQLSMWIRWCIVMFMIYTYAVEYIQTGTDIYAQIMIIVFYIIIILIHVFIYIYMYIFIYLLFYLLILFFYSLCLFITLFIYVLYICAHYIHIWVFQKRTYVAYRLFGYDSHIASCYRLRCAFAAWEQRWCR
jgi:hypothetical protein